MATPRSLLTLVLIGAAAPACADCSQFKWSVAKEIAAFAAPQPLPSVSSATALGTGYEVALARGLALPVKPQREPGAGTFAAVLDIGPLDAGLYQITLSQEAWVDVAQGGALVKSTDFSGQKDCPPIHKSVRFLLAAGAATVEISNAATASIKLAVEPAN